MRKEQICVVIVLVFLLCCHVFHFTTAQQQSQQVQQQEPETSIEPNESLDTASGDIPIDVNVGSGTRTLSAVNNLKRELNREGCPPSSHSKEMIRGKCDKKVLSLNADGCLVWSCQ